MVKTAECCRPTNCCDVCLEPSKCLVFIGVCESIMTGLWALWTAMFFIKETSGPFYTSLQHQNYRDQATVSTIALCSFPPRCLLLWKARFSTPASRWLLYYTQLASGLCLISILSLQLFTYKCVWEMFNGKDVYVVPFLLVLGVGGVELW